MYIRRIRLSYNHQAYAVKFSIVFSHPFLFLQYWHGMEKSVFQASTVIGILPRFIYECLDLCFSEACFQFLSSLDDDE